MECLEKMSYTSHFKKLLILFISIILFVEILIRFFPIYYFSEPEKFLIYHTRKKIEEGKNNYDILIFGDSISMSLDPGKYKNVYNYSFPGMNVRYYPYLLEKYLKANNKKPKAILFAGSFVLVSSGKQPPLVSRELIDYVYPDISLKDYLYNRSIIRLKSILKGEIHKPKEIPNIDRLLEALGMQRFLTLFSAWELHKEFVGPEWFYVMSQSIPLLYRTYMFRDAIQNLLNIKNYQFEENYYGTSYCSCDKLLEKVCLPPSSQLQDNMIIKKFLENNNGFYNISDRLTPKLLQKYELEKENTIKRLKEHAEIHPNFDFSYTEEFIKNLNKQKILYIYLPMPYPDIYNNGKLIPTFQREFEKFLSQFPNAKMFYFPTMYYDAKYYSDMVHLNCEGAQILNNEFQNIVLPKIVEYVESYQFK